MSIHDGNSSQQGQSSRAAQGCDCATILDEAKASAPFDAGYRYVGRYLSGTVGSGASMSSKAMTKNGNDGYL